MNGLKNLRVDYPDQELQFRVKSFLSSRHYPGFENLDVVAENGSITLSGNLDSFYEKQIAIHSCQRVAGVLVLVDQVTVETGVAADVPIQCGYANVD